MLKQFYNIINYKMRRNSIISVYDKTGVVDLALFLVKSKYNIWSSGGTYKYLKKQLDEFSSQFVFEIKDKTKFPEILNGRVKTLHPRIYGGILADRDNVEHQSDLSTHGLCLFDLVVVNLYPFSKVIENTRHTHADAIENIDIGGVSLIRAAAKNYKDVSVLVSPNQYNEYLNKYETIDLEYRKYLAGYAYHNIAQYDISIAEYFDESTHYRSYTKVTSLKYGLNPYQTKAGISSINNKQLPGILLNGSPGYINIIDAIQSWQLVEEIEKSTGLFAVSSFKHTTPTGVAVGLPLLPEECDYFNVDGSISLPALTFLRARHIDPLSSFGDFLACSGIVNEEMALKIKPYVSDGIIARGYDDKALEILKKKKRGKYIIMKSNPLFVKNDIEFKEFGGLCLMQSTNKEIIDNEWFSQIPTKETELNDIQKINLILGNIVLKYTPSNSIAFSYNGQVVGVGAGQQNRVDCVKLAGNKLNNWLLRKHPKVLRYKKSLEQQKKYKKQEIINMIYDYLEHLTNKKTFNKDSYFETFSNAICLNSDGFFPFRDNIEVANTFKVKCIMQPGGSIADDDVIETCDKFNMVMVMSGKRMFYH